MSTLAWFQERIAAYPTSKNHSKDLNDFLNELKKLNRDERKEIIAQLNFDPMFGMVIKWNNPVYAAPFYEQLVLVFEVMQASDIVNMYESCLLKLIDHVDGKFQDLVFEVLSRVVTDGELETFVTHDNLMYEAAKVLVDRNLETATPCLNFLTQLAKIVPQGTNIVFSGRVGKLLREYCDCDRTLRYRIYELVVSVANIGPEALQLMCDSGLLSELYDTLMGPTAHVDQLGFANTVEIYKSLTEKPHCYDFLVKSGVLKKLEERVIEYGPGSMEDKVMPTLYQFFGDLCATMPEKVFQDAPGVVPRVMELANISLEHTHVNRAAMLMLGQVATLPEGKRYLYKNQKQFDPALGQVDEFLHSGSEDNKIVAMDFTEALIFTKSADQSDDILEMTKYWFVTAMKSVKALWDFAKEPYPGIARTSIQVFVLETCNCQQRAISLMAVISTLPWGRSMIYDDTPGLLEWLMNRQAACGVNPRTGSGADPEILRAKYAVVKNVLELGTPGISENIKERMQTFVQEGPLFMRGQYEVTMEGE